MDDGPNYCGQTQASRRKPHKKEQGRFSHRLAEGVGRQRKVTDSRGDFHVITCTIPRRPTADGSKPTMQNAVIRKMPSLIDTTTSSSSSRRSSHHSHATTSLPSPPHSRSSSPPAVIPPSPIDDAPLAFLLHHRLSSASITVEEDDDDESNFDDIPPPSLPDDDPPQGTPLLSADTWLAKHLFNGSSRPASFALSDISSSAVSSVPPSPLRDTRAKYLSLPVIPATEEQEAILDCLDLYDDVDLPAPLGRRASGGVLVPNPESPRRGRSRVSSRHHTSRTAMSPPRSPPPSTKQLPPLLNHRRSFPESLTAAPSPSNVFGVVGGKGLRTPPRVAAVVVPTRSSSLLWEKAERMAKKRASGGGEGWGGWQEVVEEEEGEGKRASKRASTGEMRR
ncbi:hypothetical protein HDU96_009806 [Phlyctochytrium bullatum]|nr:hypothetical protein HDU96_009806 [Phlyctochytrium bullatum]